MPLKKKKRGSAASGGSTTPGEEDTVTERPREEDVDVQQQIVDALKIQNDLLRSMDARLGRIERQGGSLRPGAASVARRHSSLTTGTIIGGSWNFAEAPEATRHKEQQRIQRERKSSNARRGSYGRIEEKGKVLSGAEGYLTIHPSKPCAPYGGVYESYKPEWSGSSTTRSLLPLLELDGKAELQLKSGIYALVVKYTCNSSGKDQLDPLNTNKMEAGIIVGERELNSEGFVMAEGADWDRLLSNQRQTQLPYSH
jgi:hypothetical protein